MGRFIRQTSNQIISTDKRHRRHHCWNAVIGGGLIKHFEISEALKITGEWQLTAHSLDGKLLWQSEWLTNHITAVGLTEIAKAIAAFSSPYLVLGTDTTAGDTITEGYRKAVSAVTQDGALTRFRTQLISGEANATWQKAAIFIEASSVAGTGKMLNVLTNPITKTSNIILTVESKITAQNGGL